jgi:hypothetical protein
MNPNALIAGDDDGSICMVEDHTDPDWRMYRIEIQGTPDGQHAIAYCRYNPWGSNPYDYGTSHLREDGFLCLGPDVHGDLQSSPLDVATAIKRARYWCTGFSVLMQTGNFPDP